jgi:hypothetical protein
MNEMQRDVSLLRLQNNTRVSMEGNTLENDAGQENGTGTMLIDLNIEPVEAQISAVGVNTVADINVITTESDWALVFTNEFGNKKLLFQIWVII